MFTVAPAPLLSHRVRSGVIALNFVEPLWFLLVDEHRLDVGSDLRCPLGQVWGRFSRGIKALDIPEEDAALYGFDSPTALDENAEWDAGTVQAEYDTLSRMWRYVVRRKMHGARVIAA